MAHDPLEQLIGSARTRSAMESFTPAPKGFARHVVRQAFADPVEIAKTSWARGLTWGLTAAVTIMLLSIFWNHRALTDPLSTEITVERQLAEFIFQQP